MYVYFHAVMFFIARGYKEHLIYQTLPDPYPLMHKDKEHLICMLFKTPFLLLLVPYQA